MAPPGNRRPGYSRRAQFGTFIGYVIGVLGALVGVGATMPLVDRAMRSRLMARVFALGGGAVAVLVAGTSYVHGNHDVWLIPVFAGLPALGYAIVEGLFVIGGRISQ